MCSARPTRPRSWYRSLEPEPVGAIDDDRVRIRNIEAALNDGRADEHIDLAGDEARHYCFEFVRVHLSVAKHDPRLRTKLRDAIAHPFDRLHAIVQEENLALAFELAMDGIANDALVVTADRPSPPASRLSGGVSIVLMSFAPTSDR